MCADAFPYSATERIHSQTKIAESVATLSALHAKKPLSVLKHITRGNWEIEYLSGSEESGSRNMVKSQGWISI